MCQIHFVDFIHWFYLHCVIKNEYATETIYHKLQFKNEHLHSCLCTVFESAQCFCFDTS